MPGEREGARIEVASGKRAGLIFPLAGDLVTVGRGPDCQLRTDPDTELHVSSRHALLRHSGDGWTVLDLGSRNGTTLNDVPLSGEAPLHEGDRIVLGGETVLLFHLGPPAATSTPLASRRGVHLAWLIALALLLVGGVGAFLYAGRSDRRSWNAERARMQQRLDSLQRASEQTEAGLRGQVSGLADALRASRVEVESLRTDVAHTSAQGNAPATAALRLRLQEATAALRRQQLAAGLDFAGIQRTNRPAVAMIYVEYPDGRVATATAFAVRTNGTLVTNRHALIESEGRAPRRIGVQFAESEQVWPARLLSASQTFDLALVKVDNIVGGVPAVRALNLRLDTVAAGSAVAVIGFPLGGEHTPLRGSTATVARPVVTAGVIRETSADLLKVQGYGAAGASGSPIFDGAGAVVGVLYGGRSEGASQLLYAVPATAVERLLADTERGGSP